MLRSSSKDGVVFLVVWASLKYSLIDCGCSMMFYVAWDSEDLHPRAQSDYLGFPPRQTRRGPSAGSRSTGLWLFLSWLFWLCHSY